MTKLVHPDPSAPIALRCDASKYALGAVLETFQGGQWLPLGFWSKHLPENKQRYSTFRRELAAIHLGMRHFKAETDGKHVVIYSDHRPLISAFQNPSLVHDPVATNQIMEVSMYSNDVRFISGRDNAVADSLSRPEGTPMGSNYTLEVDSEEALPPDFEPLPDIAAVTRNSVISFETVSHSALAKEQSSCPEVASHAKGQHPRGVNMQTVEFAPQVILWCDMSKGKARPLVPKIMRKTIYSMFHMINHPGVKPTIQKVESRYYWPSLRQDVTKWVNE